MVVIQCLDKYNNIHLNAFNDFREAYDIFCLAVNNSYVYDRAGIKRENRGKAYKYMVDSFLNWLGNITIVNHPDFNITRYPGVGIKAFYMSDSLIVPSKDTFQMRNEEIRNNLMLYKMNGRSGTNVVYDDGCWQISLQVCDYGRVRFWVTYEYKNGQTNSQIVTVLSENRAVQDFVIKDRVKQRLLSIYKYLSDNGILDYNVR